MPPEQITSAPNTSGQGKLASIPAEIQEWSWGAFGLNWIWGLFNGTYIALLTFVPFVGFIMIFVLGAKGNEWAWRNKHWESVESFKKTQRTWACVFLVLFGVSIIATIAGFSAIEFQLMNARTNLQTALTQTTTQEQQVQATLNGNGGTSAPVQDYSKQSAPSTAADTSNGTHTLPQNAQGPYQEPWALVTVTGSSRGSAVDVLVTHDAYTGGTSYAEVSNMEWDSAGPIGVTNGIYAGSIELGKGSYKIFIYDDATRALLDTRNLTIIVAPVWGPPSATIDKSSLSPASPTIAGTAANISELNIAVDDNYYDPKVVSGAWSVPKALAPGNHTVTVKTPASPQTVLTTATYIIQ